MPLFGSRPQTNNVDGILQIINIGECDDHTLDQLERIVEKMNDDDVKSLADALMTNLVKYPDNVNVLTGSVKALEVLPFLPQAKNEFIITLLLSLLKAPVNRKDSLQRKTLKIEVVRFLLYFVKTDEHYATLMMPELIASMDDTHAGISTSIFHALQKIAVERPEYFERYSAPLIKQLGSINKSTRAQSAKLIGIIAKVHPEYVIKAMPFLQSLASFYPDAQVKRNSNEAYQIIWQSIKKAEEEPANVRKTDNGSKSFVDVVKLQAGPSGAETQFTDDELREIIELTRKEFKSDAEAILDSLGVGHLNVKGKPKAKVTPPAPEPPKAKRPEVSYTAPRSSTPVRHDYKETARPSQYRPQGPKCPKCGGITWAAGQLCDDCAGAEFDRKAVKSAGK